MQSKDETSTSKSETLTDFLSDSHTKESFCGTRGEMT